jgi:hypothetical protein
MNKFFRGIFFCISLTSILCCETKQKVEPGWPSITQETKPWTRWWWHGSALTKEGITTELEAYEKAGLGGVEITPIYGVHGYEDKFVNYLSPQWMKLFIHTLNEAERLGLGVDMATGTGWPFGGPWVKYDDACKNFQFKIYELKEGEQLNEKIEFIQAPYLRAVGNQVHEVGSGFSTEPTKATRQEPSVPVRKSIDIKQLIDPVEENKNLQALAIEQVQFEKPLELKTLMAYNDEGEIADLTLQVNDGKLNWTAPKGNWKLYAVFEGWHGKMVERAGPGGEGNVIDHFSQVALQNYLSKFDAAFQGKDIHALRSFFNDSYEVDDARGTANWTPLLFNEFVKRRGYDLREHLPALLSNDEEEKNQRILCDYRETISELLLENFTQPWKAWAHGKSKLVRNQAHGSPANILDLYATVDIPEIEGVDPLRIKMASSSGNVTGKKLVSSESATWLNEHFESNLSDIKVALDRFMLNGVNHIFYHGTSYSPPDEVWPGWLFYAAVHANPRNSLWKDFDALNIYVARCQSFLQNSTADNDVLLYYPIYDRFSAPGREMIEHFDGIGRQFENTAFERSAKMLSENGYAFDYISDKQITNILVNDNLLQTEGNSNYQTLVIPKCNYIPVQTFNKLISLAENGATIIVFEGLPERVSGYANLEKNQEMFDASLSKLKETNKIDDGVKEFKVGKGRFIETNELKSALSVANIRKENLLDKGISFIRKKETDNRTIYLISNQNEDAFEGWLPLESSAKSVVLYDPMTGTFGKGEIRNTEKGNTEVFVRLLKQQSMIIELYDYDVSTSPINITTPSEKKILLEGRWKISFVSGGPTLPKEIETDTLASWTTFGQEYQAFSGTASYTIQFKKPTDLKGKLILDLGQVKESGEVFLNGESLGTLIGPVYQLEISEEALHDQNTLEIQVSNLMANRIADLDKRGIFWRKFYNVNFPARKPENRKDGLFDASHWKPHESGLIGPVSLILPKK